MDIIKNLLPNSIALKLCNLKYMLYSKNKYTLHWEVVREVLHFFPFNFNAVEFANK